jgi:hypothetical protein
MCMTENSYSITFPKLHILSGLLEVSLLSTSLCAGLGFCTYQLLFKEICGFSVFTPLR